MVHQHPAEPDRHDSADRVAVCELFFSMSVSVAKGLRQAGGSAFKSAELHICSIHASSAKSVILILSGKVVVVFL